MSSATDGGMFKTMGLVGGALVMFTVIIMLAARLLGGHLADTEDPLLRNALLERIQPVGAVRTSAEDLPVAAADDVQAVAMAGAPKTGEELVNGACAACHNAGVANAPLTGNEEAWAALRDKGLDALVASVINGKGSMPARGGSSYTDEEIRRAVQHLAMFEVDDELATPAPEATAVPEATAAETAEPAETGAEASPEQPVEAGEADSDAAAPADGEAAAPVHNEIVLGQVPEGLTDNVKATVDALCISCHIAGVAGAPKVGDTAAWQARADKGLDTLTASVINGLNAMPPRGGSALTDEEIPMSILYLMSK